MQQSLKILTDVPDYADRVARLETLKNRLEALMSPTIIAAFNTHDVGKRTCLHAIGAPATLDSTPLDMSRSFAQVFQSMDRAEQLEDLYVTSVKVRHDLFSCTRKQLSGTEVNRQNTWNTLSVI